MMLKISNFEFLLTNLQIWQTSNLQQIGISVISMKKCHSNLNRWRSRTSLYQTLFEIWCFTWWGRARPLDLPTPDPEVLHPIISDLITLSHKCSYLSTDDTVRLDLELVELSGRFMSFLQVFTGRVIEIIEHEGGAIKRRVCDAATYRRKQEISYRQGTISTGINKNYFTARNLNAFERTFSMSMSVI